MLLDENNYKEQIHAFTQQDWKPLIELIPKVESTSIFGEWAGGEKGEKKPIQFPNCIEKPIVSQFLDIVYTIFIQFLDICLTIFRQLLDNFKYIFKHILNTF